MVMFQIRVKIFQARQLPGGDINSVCKVSLGKDQKSTKVKKNSAEPNWNEVSHSKQLNFNLSTFRIVLTLLVRLNLAQSENGIHNETELFYEYSFFCSTFYSI